ncbi:MAG: hypothetical protein IKN00_03655, partial [Bacteroidales bacterium]|nr:hypothetical protein [Bacteroidales bacterium]
DKLEQKMAGKEVLLTPEQSAQALKMFNLKDTPVMAFTGLDSFTGLGAMSFIHEQFRMLSMPQVIESFNIAFQALAPQTELGYGLHVEWPADLGHQMGIAIQDIANGNVESLEAYRL